MTFPARDVLSLNGETPNLKGDVARILALPVSLPSEDAQRAMADDWARKLRRRDDAPALRPIQGYALQAAYDLPAPQAPFCPIGVGWGKTWIALLMPAVLEAKRPLLLIPPDLKKNTEAAISYLGKYYRFPRPTVLSYNALSQPNATDLLDRLRPDVIIMDEAQALRAASSARTKRMSRYLKGEKAHGHGTNRVEEIPGRPDTRICAMSGSFTDASIHDYAHLAEWCLRDGSPLPLSGVTLDLWSSVLDKDGEPSDQAYTCARPLARFAPANGHPSDLEAERLAIRQGYANRLRSAPGVVSTTESSVSVPLAIRLAPRYVPSEVEAALSALSTDWIAPDGTEIVDALSFHRTSKQVAAGFYHVIQWPNNEPDTEWLEARRNWGAVVREVLRGDAFTGMDSPALVERAARARAMSGSAQRAFREWEAVRDRYGDLGPPSKAVWIDKEIIYQAMDELLGAPPTIVWYQSRAIQTELAAQGLRIFGAGSQPPGGTCQHLNCDCAQRNPFPACAIKVHHKGKNLQPWANHLVIEPPSNGLTWEQLAGRSHRPGQTRPVHIKVFHDPWPYTVAMKRARESARYIEDTTGASQKLNLAKWS